MALTILGLSGALSHDPSAALYIDGKLIAAVESELCSVMGLDEKDMWDHSGRADEPKFVWRAPNDMPTTLKSAETLVADTWDHLHIAML